MPILSGCASKLWATLVSCPSFGRYAYPLSLRDQLTLREIQRWQKRWLPAKDSRRCTSGNRPVCVKLRTKRAA